MCHFSLVTCHVEGVEVEGCQRGKAFPGERSYTKRPCIFNFSIFRHIEEFKKRFEFPFKLQNKGSLQQAKSMLPGDQQCTQLHREVAAGHHLLLQDPGGEDELHPGEGGLVI